MKKEFNYLKMEAEAIVEVSEELAIAVNKNTKVREAGKIIETLICVLIVIGIALTQTHKEQIKEHTKQLKKNTVAYNEFVKAQKDINKILGLK